MAPLVGFYSLFAPCGSHYFMHQSNLIQHLNYQFITSSSLGLGWSHLINNLNGPNDLNGLKTLRLGFYLQNVVFSKFILIKPRLLFTLVHSYFLLDGYIEIKLSFSVVVQSSFPVFNYLNQKRLGFTCFSRFGFVMSRNELKPWN